MALTPKLLFSGVPGTGEADLTTGPASGKRWVVTAVYISNITATNAWITLKHDLLGAGTTKLHLVPHSTIKAYSGIVIGPFILVYTDKIRALQETGSAIEVLAYGYEEDV